MSKALFMFPSLLCLALASGDVALQKEATTGSISGQVSIKGARTPQGTVVYIKEIDGVTFEPPQEHAVMDQKNIKFVPHVLPIQAGTTVDFLNSDDVMHNVFTPDGCAEKFNLGTWPKGEIRSFVFDKKEEGAICTPVMLCNVHPEMEAFIVVLPTPYFTTADKEGNYEIPNVPPGEYQLTTWHERCQKTSVQDIKVVAGETIRVDFSVRR